MLLVTVGDEPQCCLLLLGMSHSAGCIHVQKSSTKSGHANIQQCTGFSGSCLAMKITKMAACRSRQKKPEFTKEWIVGRWFKGP